MKSLALVKTTPDMQLGHLYEHIFVKNLQQYLRNQGWISCLDYSVFGMTFKTGFIVLRIRSYSENLDLQIEKIVENLQIDFSEDEIAGAALQIFAEKMVDSVGFEENTTQELVLLEQKKWQKLEDVSIDFGVNIPYDQYLNLEPVSLKKFYNLRLSLGFSGEDALLPLFLILGKIIENNVAEILENERYSFLTEMDFDEKNCLFVSIFRRSKRQKVEKEEAWAVKEVIESLKQTKQIRKIVEAGQKSFCINDEWIATPVEILERSSRLIGKRGWQELVSVENILKVLDSITIEIELI